MTSKVLFTNSKKTLRFEVSDKVYSTKLSWPYSSFNWQNFLNIFTFLRNWHIDVIETDSSKLVASAYFFEVPYFYSRLPKSIAFFVNFIKLTSLNGHFVPEFKNGITSDQKDEIVKALEEFILTHFRRIGPLTLFPISEKYNNSNNKYCTIEATPILELTNFSLNNLDESIKSSLRKSSKLGVKFKIVNDLKELKFWYDGLRDGWKFNNIKVPAFIYYRLQFEIFKSDILFVYSELNGKIISGTAAVINGNKAIEFSMFTSSYAKLNKIPGHSAKYQLINYLKDAGVLLLNQNMVSLSGNSSIAFSKLQWGGKIEKVVLIKRKDYIPFRRNFIG